MLLLAALHPDPWPPSPMLGDLLRWARAEASPDEQDRYLYIGGVMVAVLVLVTCGSAFGARYRLLRSGPGARSVVVIALAPLVMVVIEVAVLEGARVPLLPVVLLLAVSLALVAGALVRPRQDPPDPAMGQEQDVGQGLAAGSGTTGGRSVLAMRRAGALALILATGALLWPFEPSAVAQYVMNADAFHHWAYFAIAPGHAYLMGLTPVIQAYSQYGLGAPIILAQVARALGGFGYSSVLAAGAGYIATYFVGLFVLIWLWQRSVLWAAAGTAVAILIQNFSGVDQGALLLVHPSSTVLRSAFDVWMILLIVLHLRLRRTSLLYGAGIVGGVALYWETDTGIYLVLALGWLLVLRLVAPAAGSHLSWRAVIDAVMVLVLALATFLALAFATVGRAILDPALWDALLWPIRVFSSGYGMLPMPPPSVATAHLYLTPAVYLVALVLPLTTIACCGRVWTGGIVGSVLGAYGLLLYDHYIGRSHPYNWHHVSIPLVLIATWAGASLARRIASTVPDQRTGTTAVTLGRWCAIALPTVVLAAATVLMLKDPSLQRWTVVAHGEGGPESLSAPIPAGLNVRDVEAVVARIRQLVPPGQKLAVLSELDHLYYVLSERPPFTRSVPLYPVVITRSQLEVVLLDLRRDGPQYVFLDRRSSDQMWSAEIQPVLFAEVARDYDLQEVVAGSEVWRRK